MIIATFEQFLEAVDKLVLKWKTADDYEHAPESETPSQNVPQSVLREIYDEVREQTAHNLAQLEERR